MKKTGKRVFAWIGIVLLVLMYIVLLVSALLKVPYWDKLFSVTLIVTILLPIVLWVNIYLYDRIIGKNKKDDGEPEES